MWAVKTPSPNAPGFRRRARSSRPTHAIGRAGTAEVESLREGLRIPAKVAFLKAHYSHRMGVNLVIVLRCRPSALRKRLEARGWPSEKVRENVEAEAIDVILQEAVARHPFVYEIDTSERTPADSAAAVLAILQGKTEGHEPGGVDWSEEGLSWS